MQRPSQNKRQFLSLSTRCRIILRIKEVLEPYHQMQNNTPNKRLFWRLTTRCKIILTTKENSGASQPDAKNKSSGAIPPDAVSYSEQKTAPPSDAELYSEQKTVLEPHHQMQRHSHNKRQFWCKIILTTKDSWSFTTILTFKRQFWSLTATCSIIHKTKDSSGASPPDAETLSEQKTVLELHHQM